MKRLALDRVSFKYRNSPTSTIDKLSFTIEDGTATAIIGPNGSGKSTVLGLCGGRLRAASGTVRESGIALESLSPKARAARIAVLPQAERIAFDFSCLEFVLFARAHLHSPFADPTGADIEAAETALESLGVGALSSRKITEISGGELQLVRLARCVAQEASCLLLDEPTSMLDPAHAAAVAAAVKSIAARGRAVLFSTHDFGFAAAVADRVMILANGRMLAMETPENALTLNNLEQAFGIRFRVAPLPSPG